MGSSPLGDIFFFHFVVPFLAVGEYTRPFGARSVNLIAFFLFDGGSSLLLSVVQACKGKLQPLLIFPRCCAVLYNRSLFAMDHDVFLLDFSLDQKCQTGSPGVFFEIEGSTELKNGLDYAYPKDEIKAGSPLI